MTNIPQVLRERRQWVLWRTGVREGGDKPTKLPMQLSGALAKSDDPKTWTGFDAATERLKLGGCDGCGFVFDDADPFCGIDLDGCRDPDTGAVSEWARAIIREFNSYSEVSPTKTGVKIFIRAKNPMATGRKVTIREPRTCEAKEPAVEVYDRGRYFAVTGWRLSGVSPDVEPRQRELDALCARLWPDEPSGGEDWHSPAAVVERARRYLAKMPGAVSGEKGHDRAFHAACVLLLGFGLAHDEARMLFMEWNATCQPPWSDRDIEHKLKDAAAQNGPRNFLRLAKPENYAKVKFPEWREPERKPDPPPPAEVKTTTLKAAAVGYIEKIASGLAAAVELGIPDLDYALGGGVEYGEMVIVAGRPSHGKSCVALQFIHNVTARGIPAMFLSEEMSRLAVGKRALQFATAVHQEYWGLQTPDLIQDVEKHFADRAPSFLIESCRRTDVAAEVVRRHVKENGVRFVIVDYAQLLVSKGKDRYEQVTNTSIALRQLANETGVVLVALAQLNRAIEHREKFVPCMADLRDTGQLEQDSDVVVAAVWPHRLNTGIAKEQYQFFVLKNRNRPINQNMVQCRFDAMRQMIVEEPRHQAFTATTVPNSANPGDW